MCLDDVQKPEPSRLLLWISAKSRRLLCGKHGSGRGPSCFHGGGPYCHGNGQRACLKLQHKPCGRRVTDVNRLNRRTAPSPAASVCSGRTGGPSCQRIQLNSQSTSSLRSISQPGALEGAKGSGPKAGEEEKRFQLNKPARSVSTL